jgi:phage-related protein
MRGAAAGSAAGAGSRRLEADDERRAKGPRIRIQTELAHRVFYFATFEEAVYVLHAFEKKTRKTPAPDVALAQDRYRGLLKKRAEDAKKK